MPVHILLKRIGLSIFVGLLSGVLLSEISFYFLKSGETRAPQTILLTIPPGTAARVARGEADPSIPSNLIFVMGDTLLVANRDSVTHTLGPLFIPAGASATMNLNAIQQYSFACSFAPSKYLGLSVQSPLDIWTRLFGVMEIALPMTFLILLYSLILPYPKPKEASIV